MCLYVCVLAIDGHTTGLNGLTHWVRYAKKSIFFNNTGKPGNSASKLYIYKLFSKPNI